MKIQIKHITIALFLACTPSLLFSQMWEYEQKDVEKIVWTDDSYFPDENLKPEWKDKSAIILDYNLIQEFKETSSMGVGHTTLKHFKIKLLDQASVDNYSEFYFSRNRTAYYNLFYKNFVGFRIIKPNGDVVVIDSKKEMIVEKDNYEIKKKIAIPNLQVGDILDYYLFNYRYEYQSNIKQRRKASGTNYYLAEDQYLLPKKYPVIKLKYEIIADEDWRITLKGINNCEIKESKTGDDEYRFIVESEDLDEIGDLYWDFIYRTRPSFKLYAEWQTNYIKKLEKDGSKYFSIREADEEVIQNNVKALYDADISGLFGDFIKFLKKNKQENISKEKKIEEYYYFLRHRFVNMHLMYDAYNETMERSISHFNFCQHMIFALKKLDISYDYLLAVPRKEGNIPEILSTRETLPILKINFSTPKFIYFDGKHSKFNLLPLSIEGVNCMAVKKSSNKKDFIFKDYQMPESNAENNILSSKTELQFIDQSLNIEGNIAVKGQDMPSYQNYFVSIFDFVFNENIKYSTKRWGDPTILKDGKMKDKIIQMREDKEHEFKKNFEEYIVNYLEIDKLEIGSVKKEKLGIDSEEDEFMIKYNATSNELINKVGSNFIIKIGKLTGTQIQIKEDEFERNYDVYVPYPRVETHSISLTIPENYELKGVENLNKKVENQYGSFESKAVLNGNKLEFECTQKIITNFVKKEDWNNLIEILNAAYNNQQQEILLKKI